MKVSVMQQNKVNGIEVSVVITIETERGELSKAEVLAMMKLLQEAKDNE
jgi:hypothetical protein